MWIGKATLEQFKAQIQAVKEANDRYKTSIEQLQMKMAGLEAYLDRLERDGMNERSGLDRMIR